jgi:hypothetical protein
MCPRDTSPEAWRVFLDLQRKMTPSEKLHRTLEYSDSIRRLAVAGVRQRYPNADEPEVFLRTARSILGDELFRRAYGGRIHEGA